MAQGYAELVSTRTGMRFQAWSAPSSTAAVHALCSQQADLTLLLGTPGDAPCRLAASRPYYRGQALLARRSTNTTPLQLGGEVPPRVAVVRGTRYPPWLATHYPQVQVVAVADMSGALWAVESGVTDAALGLDLVMRPLVHRGHADSLRLDSAPADLPGSLHLIARASDQWLLDDIDAAVQAITPQQHAQLLQRVMQSSRQDMPSTAVLLRHFRWELMALGAGLSLLLAAGFWLILARRAAQRSERRQARFIGVMSHEVGNAAQAMVASVDLLDYSSLDQRQRQLVDAARAAGSGLRHLLSDALDYSRMATGMLRSRLDWHDINPLLHDCVNAIRPATEAKGLRLTLQLYPDPLPTLWIDAAALRQILANLLGNACKFTPKGGIEVCISLRRDADAHQLRLAVSDTGIGIPDAHQARVFKPFAQAHDAHSRALGGTGLGLSICHGLVQALHGQVHLHSAPGRGSRFDITLPVSILPAEPAASLPLRGHSILLVEDHDANRAVVARQLEMLGASVQTCCDGAGALQLQERAASTVVLIDCELADMTGYQLARALRALEHTRARPAALLVALSATGSQAHVQRCRTSGMDAVLFKPLDQARLLAILGVSEHPTLAPTRIVHADTLQLLHALQDELLSLQGAYANDATAALRHHAHRASGLLRMLGQEPLADIAADLHELDLDTASNRAEVGRLLAPLQQAVAGLVGSALT